MARYTSQAKMGYYPTPPSQVEKIANKLAWSGPCRLYDPCCGQGEALAQVGAAAPTGSQTYGIELDGHRAEQAACHLHEARCCGYSGARVEKQSMSLLWLNPPYDADSGAATGLDRSELRFLRDITKQGMLQPGGVLVFIVPRTILTDTVVNALFMRYTNVAVYRFTGAEYDAFGQVVVFGVRRKESVSRLTRNETARRHWLLRWGRSDTGEPLPGDADQESAIQARPLPTLDEEDDQVWNVPIAETMDPILFRGHLLDEAELRQDLLRSDVLTVAQDRLADAVARTVLAQPPLPFRTMHLATLIAAGALNGAIGIGPGRHALVGSTRKVVSTTEVTNDEGNSTLISSESYVASATIVVEDGTILDLN